MAPRKIVLVGVQVANDDVDELEFDSTSTLLDWDVVIFKPDISDMLAYNDSYQGKTCLDESRSFRLKEHSEHWRREIKHAVDAGRTVICYLHPLVDIFVDSGKREYSGTGRNRQTTRIVEPYSNYTCLPLQLNPRNATGTAMKLSVKAGALAEYWAAFGDVSSFKVTLHGVSPAASIMTKVGGLTVGGIYTTASGGHLIALPMLDFYPDDFFEGDGEFNEDAKKFAARLIHSWLALDQALRSDSQVTPPPAWSEEDIFALSQESELKAQLLAAEAALTASQKQKEEAADSLREAGSLRLLLFEKGTPLENTIIKALKLLGFEAAPYKDSASEFDVVFQSAEGRLLGEAEGKDNKAINIDKLRQLAMNVLEDLDREEVTEPAKAILFGNGYRLQPPDTRAVQFTEKCLSSATQSGTGLVPTSELFRVCKYVSDSGDAEFAKRCRVALLEGVGIITLPQTPKPKANSAVSSSENAAS